MKEKSKKITKLKQIIFLVLVLIIARFAMYIVGNGNISSLEGYLYSLAATATSCDATSCNATSTNAQLPCATCSNATCSNATSSNATSSNAQVPCATASNATSSNTNVPCATASNAKNSEVVKNTTTKAQTTTTVATDKKDEKDNVEIKEDEIVESEDNVEETIEENIVETEEKSTVLSTEYSKTSGEKQEKEVVSFLESHRTYVIIIAFSILAIAIISFILYIDNKGIEKRKKAAETQENKNQDKPEQK